MPRLGLVSVVLQKWERKSKDLKITKESSGLLRWALVEAAWRLVGSSPRWAALFARLRNRRGEEAGHLSYEKESCSACSTPCSGRRLRTRS